MDLVCLNLDIGLSYFFHIYPDITQYTEEPVLSSLNWCSIRNSNRHLETIIFRVVPCVLGYFDRPMLQRYPVNVDYAKLNTTVPGKPCFNFTLTIKVSTQTVFYDHFKSEKMRVIMDPGKVR